MSDLVRTGRVLVAEDDAAMREMLATQLRRAGLQVELASDGDELRTQLASRGSNGSDDVPDIVVSDVKMPGWTGLEALRWVRNHRPQIHVILITAFGDPLTHRRARRLGAVAVFDKPFDLPDLLRTVRELLGRVVR